MGPHTMGTKSSPLQHADRLDQPAKHEAYNEIETLQKIPQEQTSTRPEWPHENTATMILYLRKRNWRTPFLWRLRSISTQWKIAIESLEWEEIDLSSCSQGVIQPRNSHRLGLIRDGGLIAHNCRVYETVHDAAWKPHPTPPDRGIGLSGAQLLNNLQLNPSALLAQSPFRENVVHLNISGCQSINTSAIDTLLRLSHSNLPKLQRIHMEGLRLESCQRAAKSFLRSFPRKNAD